MNKKSQITIFILLGLILLVGLGFLTYYYKEYIFAHELGHTIAGLSNPHTIQERLDNRNLLLSGDFNDKYAQKAEEFGMQLEEERSDEGYLIRRKIKSGPEGLFPSYYSKTNIAEHQAEIFTKIIHDPEWFDDITISEQLRKQRQFFRDLYLEELKKYKK